MNQPTTPHTPKPTAKQMRYLKALAEERGQSFTYPKTKAQASAEIDRLRGAKKTPSADARRERRQVSEHMATRRGDNARIRDSEVQGYGSSATWAHDGDDDGGR